ncbi:MAG: branched-chain alpha-keto acid dehydrogenase subunit E2 [Verrucomicrobia bacterium]|nr:branched-chain alpha-keto acid dehydrogenase subunit E2 [Verrucomicrobiota bacterium]
MDLKLPQLGEGAESGVVVSVLINPGDMVTKGQTILELESEKAVAPIPSSETGRVESVRVKPGDRLSYGQVIAVLSGGNGSTAPSASPPVAGVQPAHGAAQAATPPAAAGVTTGGMWNSGANLSGPMPSASPYVRKVAGDLGIDLRRVRSSGTGGRVTLADLRDWMQQCLALAEAPPAGSSAGASPGAAKPVSIDFSAWGPVRRQPMSSLRKVISRRMVENASTIPHVTQFDDLDVTRLMEVRHRHAKAFESSGVKLTLTPLILKTLSGVLMRHPIFNASLDEATEEIVFKDHVHLGIAVDTEAGLIVPVLRDVERKSVLEIARELESLARKARERKVAPDELKGGTFTVSNQGGIGGTHFTPIINKPESAILGLGRSAAKPVAVEGRVEIRTLMPIALSYDHRLIDGGSAARWVVDFGASLSQFDEALLR